MKQQTIIISGSSIVDVSITSTSKNIETRQVGINVKGFLFTAMAEDESDGTCKLIKAATIELNSENPAIRIDGTAIYERLTPAPVNGGFIFPMNVFTPCTFELKAPDDWRLTIVMHHEKPSLGSFINYVCSLTVFYDEIEPYNASAGFIKRRK